MSRRQLDKHRWNQDGWLGGGRDLGVISTRLAGMGAAEADRERGYVRGKRQKKEGHRRSSQPLPCRRWMGRPSRYRRHLGPQQEHVTVGSREGGRSMCRPIEI